MEESLDRMTNLKAMKESLDRVTNLPDSILHHILSLMPMKSAVRTSILSSRWRNLWKHVWIYTTTLDFGTEFAGSQTPEEFATTVNRYLQLHNGKRIETFRLFFDQGVNHLLDAEKWIEFACAKGVEEFDLDFCRPVFKFGEEAAAPKLPGCLFECDSPVFKFGEEAAAPKLPGCLFECDSLVHLSLSHCNFSPPLNFKGFRVLRSLRLKDVDITDDTVETIISNCPLLKELILRECFSLGCTKISAPDIPLEFLAVIDCSTYDIEISAPNLRSFHFCGDFCYGYTFKNISSLVDALINSTGHECTEPEHDYIKLISDLDPVRVLTLCEGALLNITTSETYNPEELPITLNNVQELQLVMSSLFDESLSYLYAFFRNCFIPCLEKLFIDLPSVAVTPYDPGYYVEPPVVEEPLECNFNHLKAIKINYCRGHPNEMRLVKYLLEKAIILEILVLVMAPISNEKDKNNANKDSTSKSEAPQMPLSSDIREQLLLLPNASSHARIVLYEYSEDNNNLCPTHTDVYCKR